MAATAAATAVVRKADPIVQYVVVRADLANGLRWPFGAVMTQACHASVAAMHRFREQPESLAYVADLERMHTVLVEIKDQPALLGLSEKLRASELDHHVWIEHPEMEATALATRPIYRSTAPKCLKKLRLFKDPLPRDAAEQPPAALAEP
ncbi:uncharacterized protein MONBRDRAFT_14689 [Monosiga brevicollis MX1]|uniref:peptidyl-tRNA hydrolase n=1 Tax=Monosiga brevicollis TaxID=81824 RepID=A9URI7_MONBE|nr:uncharacterized protein MONBRDRAFT_14689 [Monosiga brevicollis MX1]EDQ91930.1 predicted protein [Monosiga brevicollis MX1]|eukprot:XP_001743216.1 hypothetical protein [Monosiga brevicollis MX1]